MSTAKRILAKIDNLPPLPGVVAQVLDITSKSDFDMNALVRLVSVDPGITAQVLRLCNSAFFGLRFQATSLSQALPHLGTRNLVEVVLSSEVSKMYRGKQGGYKLAHGQLWRHSMATALIAKRLAQLAKHPDPAAVYTGGLLHDVGKLFLSEFVQDEYQAITNLVLDEGWPLHDAEYKILKIDHAQFGGLAAKKWHLAPAVREAITYHHEPAKSHLDRATTNLVSLANYLAFLSGESGGLGDERRMAPATAVFDLQIRPEALERLTEEMKELMAQAQPLLSLVD